MSKDPTEIVLIADSEPNTVRVIVGNLKSCIHLVTDTRDKADRTFRNPEIRVVGAIVSNPLQGVDLEPEFFDSWREYEARRGGRSAFIIVNLQNSHAFNNDRQSLLAAASVNEVVHYREPLQEPIEPLRLALHEMLKYIGSSER